MEDREEMSTYLLLNLELRIPEVGRSPHHDGRDVFVLPTDNGADH